MQPEIADAHGGSRGGDTAKLRLRRDRRRRPLLALTFALVGLVGATAAGFGIAAQLKPRQFTAAQQKRIEAWEVARRWRTMPKTEIFPAVVSYRLGGGQLGSGTLQLHATRLEIARQAACGKAAGARPQLLALLDHGGCQALLRATYADATDSMVLTVGVAVMKDQTGASAVIHYLTGRAGTHGGVSARLVLHPLRVSGTPAALFGMRQRQLSWVVGARSFVVLATAGFADGRPRVAVRDDAYAYVEMASLARGVAAAVATPLGARPPVPHCPGALTAC
jgi:hypothetical protein